MNWLTAFVIAAAAIISPATCHAQQAAPTVGGAPLEKITIPAPDNSGRQLATNLFRPKGGGLKRLAVINHGFVPDPAAQRAYAVPVYGWVTRWLVERDFIVALPLRRGYGATGGKLDELPSCTLLDFDRAGLEVASDIQATIEHMTKNYNVDHDRIYAIGHSVGGWGAIALSSLNPKGLRGAISFGGGMSCGRQFRDDPARRQPYDASWTKLGSIAGRFGKSSRVPTSWIYASNDSFIDIDGIQKAHQSFVANGGRADLRIVAAFGTEGHNLFTDPTGVPVWSPLVDAFIASTSGRR